MQDTNTKLTAKQMRFYAGQSWEEMQRGADELAQRMSRKRTSDAERLDFIETSARLEGGIRMAQQLAPEIRRRHREGMERSFSHLLCELQRLEGVPAIAVEDRGAAQQEALAVLSLMDGGEEEEAEERLRQLEQRVEQMAIEGIDRDITARLGAIRSLLDAVA